MPARRLALALCLTVLAFPALPRAEAAPPGAGDCQGDPSTVRLTVQVDGVRSSDGLMAVTLYPDDPKRFLARHGSLKVFRASARAGATNVCLYLPGPGYYAVAVYHDANANRHLDRAGLFPKEGSGLSNNPPVDLLHFPTLKASRFATHAGDNRIEVALHYPH
jgi:uncharacterized protein (DUF2141 family)